MHEKKFISEKKVYFVHKISYDFFSHSLDISHFPPFQISNLHTKIVNKFFVVVYTKISKHVGMREIFGS